VRSGGLIVRELKPCGSEPQDQRLPGSAAARGLVRIWHRGGAMRRHTRRMPAAAPRYDQRLLDAIRRVDDDTEPIAETCRRVGEVATALGLPRPSYVHVRRIVRMERSVDRDVGRRSTTSSPTSSSAVRRRFCVADALFHLRRSFAQGTVTVAGPVVPCGSEPQGDAAPRLRCAAPTRGAHRS